MAFSSFAAYPHANGNMLETDELDADYFDEFLTFSPNNSTTPEPYECPEDLLEVSDSRSGSSLTDEEAIQSKFWATTNNAASLSAQGFYFYGELSGRAAVSDSEILSLEGITLDSPQIPPHPQLSLPSSPTIAVANKKKNRIVLSLVKPLKRRTISTDRSALRSPIRKPNSPKMMIHNKRNSEDFWEQKLQLGKFDFELGLNNLPLSPPPSGRESDVSAESNSKATSKGKLLNGFTYKPTPNNYNPITPMTTPTLEEHLSRRNAQQLSEESFFPITPEALAAPAQWSRIVRAAELRNQQLSTVSPADIDVPLWWNHVSALSMAQPAPSQYHANPQQATHSLAMQLQNYLTPIHTSGLMIQVPQMPNQQLFMSAPPMQEQGFDAAAGNNSQPQQWRHQHQSRQYSQNHQQHQPPRRQLPYSSPTRHKPHRSSSDSESSPSGKYSPKFQVRKRKSSSKNHKHSIPRTPSTPTTLGKADFVNYTPSDSKKILTGVAPSGSSKTKARREKEALEKRRELSQAAVRAVRAAGGDVKSLVEQGLLV